MCMDVTRNKEEKEELMIDINLDILTLCETKLKERGKGFFRNTYDYKSGVGKQTKAKGREPIPKKE